MSELAFKPDTRHRKQFFTGVSFSHPAKMMLPLELWLIENYSKPGDVILDPMGGSGTLLVACAMGRHVITVELEQKFVDMQRGNWLKICERGPMMGYQMGTAQMIQGDARNLPALLVDKCIFSPPYAEAQATTDDAYVSKHNTGGKLATHHVSTGNLGNLPYGSIDKVIRSPPYEGTVSQGEGPLAVKAPHASQGDKMLTSYSADSGNIGNLKSDSYLAAMLTVYQNCHSVLKAGGVMCLVTKNFIRNRKEVRLDLDTIKLCEQAGFTFKERHHRKLTSQSF